jgi:hypothetical protein
MHSLLHVSVHLDHPQGAYADPCQSHTFVELSVKYIVKSFCSVVATCVSGCCVYRMPCRVWQSRTLHSVTPVLCVDWFGLIKKNKSSITIQYITLTYWRKRHKCYGLWGWRHSRLPLFACCIFYKPLFWLMSTSTKRLPLHNITTQ